MAHSCIVSYCRGVSWKHCRRCLHMSLVAHQAGAYPGFRSMKRLGVLLLPPGRDASPSQGTPSSKFTGTHLYTWVERGTMRVKYLAQEHNAVSRPGLEPGPPDPESSALTIRPLRRCRAHQNESKKYLETS